jgi:hypothetical protein
VTSIPADIITSDFFGYTTSYDIRDSLKPMHSYWVKTSASGMLILSYSASSSFSKGLSSTNSLQGLNTLTIVDSKLNEGKLYFGSGGKLVVNRHVLPPVPPEGMYDVRFTTGNMVAVAGDAKGNDIPIQINSGVYPITIRWGMRDVAQSASLIVDGHAISLSQTGSTEITNPKSEIKLRLSSVASNEIPKEFALHQNYPNPFNPTTIIKYQLPIESHVTLKIYNILGQEVITLVDEIQDAGFKSVEWNPSTSSGQGLASGVYFYRLMAESPGKSFVAVKKLLLMK